MVNPLDLSLLVTYPSVAIVVIEIAGSVLSNNQLNWVAAELVLPAPSLYPPPATSMVVAPSAVGVNVAV